MLSSLGLSSAQVEFLEAIAGQLSELPGIVAIVLGRRLDSNSGWQAGPFVSQY
jgi:hypothetical protein